MLSDHLQDKMSNERDQDLPLMANTDDILVDHYILHMNVDFETKVFHSKAYVFVTPVRPNKSAKKTTNGVIILDCKDIHVDNVEEVVLDHDLYVNDDPSENFRPLFFAGDDFAGKVANMRHLATLDYSVEDWCIRIWKAGNEGSARSPRAYPRAFCVSYRTSSTGASVSWRRDQDGRACCFTPGSWVNNRALFPCQEPPVAMATWDAHIKVPRGAVVITSADEEPRIKQQSDGGEMYMFRTQMELPMSTFALAIGYWTVMEMESSCAPLALQRGGSGSEVEREHFGYFYPRDGVGAADVRCRIIAPSSMVDKVSQELSTYLKKSLRAATRLLGPYPFRRLDLLILPSSFDSLGLASPNVTFLSHSLVAGDGSMCVHVAHELSHAWFGLLIGARDWTEEWLSEGFATFMEDQIHARAMEWSETEANEWEHIRTFLRYRMLVSEMENTECELQTLRPNKDTRIKDAEDGSVVYVKNGMNPNKSFTQVHYLKGFFLLRHLSDLVGNEKFISFLKEFIIRYHGQLIHSQEFFNLLFEIFPEINVGVTSLYDEWLDFPGVPVALKNDDPTPTNKLYVEILTQVKWWQEHNTYHLIKNKRRAKKHKWDFEELKLLIHSEQLVAFLELLLNETNISKQTLTSVRDHYKLDTQNANVRHRWCELIVKHNYEPGLALVHNFLTEDQAMGIYLYGELLSSKRKSLNNLAISCWQLLRDEIGASARQVVQQMVDEMWPPKRTSSFHYK